MCRELSALRSEFRHEIAAVRHELQMIELRRNLEFEKLKAKAAWRRLVGAVIGTSVINVAAIVGAIFGVAKLLGH